MTEWQPHMTELTKRGKKKRFFKLQNFCYKEKYTVAIGIANGVKR